MFTLWYTLWYTFIWEKDGEFDGQKYQFIRESFKL